MRGTATLAECTAKLKQASRNYAKRQLTWFRRQTDPSGWISPTPAWKRKAVRLVEAFLAGAPHSG